MSVLHTGGKLVEGTVGDVETLATAVVEVEPPLKFLDPDYDSINALDWALRRGLVKVRFHGNAVRSETRRQRRQMSLWRSSSI